MISKIKYSLLGLLFLVSCRAHYLVRDADFDDYRFDEQATVKGDTDIETIISPYKEDMESRMNTVIGYSETDLIKAQPESTMGNFVADAMVEMARIYSGKAVDIGIHNYGGMRIGSIDKGPISLGKIYELIPFDNAIVIMEVDGSVLREFCNYIAGRKGWPVSRSLRFVIEDGKAKDIYVNGQELKDTDKYMLVTIDYLANGGDYCNFLKPVPHESLGIYTRDVLADYIGRLHKKNEKIIVELDQRISLK